MPESMDASLENLNESQNARDMGFPNIVVSAVAMGEVIAYASLGSYLPTRYFVCTRRATGFEVSVF